MGTKQSNYPNKGKVIINNTYELIELLGSGSDADVYLGKSLKDGAMFAVKIY